MYIDKRDLFPFSIFRMPDKSRNLLSSIVYPVIGAESLRTTRASNNPVSFSMSIKPLFVCMTRHGVFMGKVNSFILSFLNKHQAGFNVCQSKQELLNLIS